jgi:hypothetical protein
MIDHAFLPHDAHTIGSPGVPSGFMSIDIIFQMRLYISVGEPVLSNEYYRIVRVYTMYFRMRMFILGWGQISFSAPSGSKHSKTRRKAPGIGVHTNYPYFI